MEDEPFASTFATRSACASGRGRATFSSVLSARCVAARRVIGRFPGEISCLSLCWAVLDLFIAGASGLGITGLDHQHIARLRALRWPIDDAALSAWDDNNSRERCSPSTGAGTRPRRLDAAEMGFRVTRGDVVAVIHQELTDDRFLGQPAHVVSVSDMTGSSVPG